MTWIEYVLEYYLIDFHKHYFRLLYRATVKLNHQFGLVAMTKSLFKPLFGMPGPFTRLNGFIFRSLAISLGLVIIVSVVVLALIGYVGMLSAPFILGMRHPMYLVAIISMAVLFKSYTYLAFPVKKINEHSIKEYRLTAS